MAKKFYFMGQEVLYYSERRSLPNKMLDLMVMFPN